MTRRGLAPTHERQCTRLFLRLRHLYQGVFHHTTCTPLPAQPLPRGLHRLLTRTRCTASVWMAQNGWTTDRGTVPPTIRACVHALSLHTDLQSGRWGGSHSPPLLVG